MKNLSLFLIALCFVGSALAQPTFLPPAEDRRLKLPAIYTTEKIVLDGHLDEKAWKASSVTSPFITCFPDQGKAPTAATEVRVLYDSVNLYIGAICHFTGGKRRLLVQDMRRDFSNFENEGFNVMLEPFGQLSMPVAAFCVTPFGTQADMMFYQGGIIDYDWDGLWRAHCVIGDSTWTAEIAIPFATLRYPAGSSAWRINFSRNIRTVGELSGWSPWPIAYDASHMEYAGLLTGIKPPQPQTNIRFEPYALLKTTGSGGSQTVGQAAGGELKWAVRTNTSLEATINTDFAQVDVDQQVINLTRSTVFFPEKRQFFKENANLFALGQDAMIQPFFSRQIGLSDSGAVLPITGGLRLVHQDAATSAGFLLMRQGGDTTNVPAWFGIARWRRDLGHGVQLGAMSVNRYNEAAPGQASSWNPVGVLDGFWRMKQTMFLRGMVSGSADNHTRDKGSAGLMEYNYADNRFYADLLGAYASKGYSTQTGYLERTDFIHLQPNVEMFLTPHWLPHNATFFYQQVIGNLFKTASTGQFQEASLAISPVGFLFRDLSSINATITTSWENLDSIFSPVTDLTIGPGRYRYTRYELDGSTNQGAHYSLQARISTGGYYNGRLNSWFVSLRAAPIPHIALVMNYTRNDFKGVGETKGRVTDYLLAPELRVAWNPRLQLSSYYQYNTAGNTGSLHLRFSWEYRPLSFVYFVWNDVRDIQPVKPPSAPTNQQAGIIKLSYIRQL
ncbi:carbohydrate binding family 9 domain-containing protein [Puia dinghuensis]|uniref:DUF5916 domain-containing protein n=1 Tax=Puia dinghuensis TaxID=1792502 RepID=A0A8J2U7T6_9BACT|nr:carbohydrate binding family 9 domain-containing protein [Puia dinghuensis]GGA84652.1 hypothetical protein GCM10011511_04620 [Puia dinghuensis]